MRFLLIFGFLAASLTNTVASEDHQSGSKRLWASYYCSALARMASDTTKQEQLIQSGTALGRPIIEAVDKGEADAFLIGKEIPGFIFTRTGISVDFQLGAIWMEAEGAAVKDVMKHYDSESADAFSALTIAKQELRLRNCDLL